ncbi:hypothetical protein MMC18_008911 [Xylographa bjoerkii]|nr:hypothetical protein [Xylographa bjoerkii]
MVRQPYMTRLVLGRSAYEPPEWQEGERPREEESAKVQEVVDAIGPTNLPNPEDYVQHYDTRGHPENPSSRSLARRSRRAQNDILTTVGVCVTVDKNGRRIPPTSISLENQQLERKQILSVISESEFGFWLGAAEGSLWPLLMNGLGALRLRLETFGTYSGIPLIDSFRIEWHRFGALKWLFAGIVADFSYELLDAGRSVLIEESREALLRHFASSEVPEKRRKWATRAIALFENLLNITSFIAISPLEILRILQHLDLLPAWPLFPSLRNITIASLSPLLYPAVPSHWNLRTSLGFAIGICTSPLPLLLGFQYVNRQVDAYLLSYARIVVPRPDCPDEISKSAYDEHPTNLDAWSMELNRHKRSLLDEIKSDLRVARDQFENLRIRLGLDWPVRDIRHFFVVSRQEPCSSVNTDRQALHGTTRIVGSPIQLQERQPPTQSTSNLEGGSVTGELHTRIDESNMPEITTAHHIQDHQPSQRLSNPSLGTGDVASTSNIAGRRGSRSTATPSPQLTASTDEEEVMMRALEEDNPVQITTSAGSTDTLHMNVEVNGTSPGEPVFTSSFSASPRPTLVETVEVQHVEGNLILSSDTTAKLTMG